MKIKPRTEDHEMIGFVIFAAHDKVSMQQSSGCGHILPCEPWVRTQALNALGPLLLKDGLKLGFQPKRKMMFLRQEETS